MYKVKKIMFVSLLLISAFLYGRPEGMETLDLGAKAPDFNLKGVDGKMHSLEDYSDSEILVIIFTANHCPTAQAYEQRIIDLASDYKDKKVQVVAISSNDPNALRLDEMGYSDLGDSYEDMKIRAKQKDFNFPYLYDGDEQKTARAYGPVATPHVFIFDEKRKLRYIGRFDNSEHEEKVNSKDARNAVEALLAGKEVPVKKTKVFGCSIKWSDKAKQAKKARKQWAKEEVNVEIVEKNKVQNMVKNNSDNLRLINFWATWCGPCKTEFPDLMKVNYIYRNRDFESITVSMDSPKNKDKVIEFLKKQNASNRNYIFDGDKYALMEAVDSEWPGSVPYTILVKPNGEIIYRKVGAVTDLLKLRRKIVEYLGRTYQ